MRNIGVPGLIVLILASSQSASANALGRQILNCRINKAAGVPSASINSTLGLDRSVSVESMRVFINDATAINGGANSWNAEGFIELDIKGTNTNLLLAANLAGNGDFFQVTFFSVNGKTQLYGGYNPATEKSFNLSSDFPRVAMAIPLFQCIYL